MRAKASANSSPAVLSMSAWFGVKELVEPSHTLHALRRAANAREASSLVRRRW